MTQHKPVTFTPYEWQRLCVAAGCTVKTGKAKVRERLIKGMVQRQPTKSGEDKWHRRCNQAARDLRVLQADNKRLGRENLELVAENKRLRELRAEEAGA